MHDVHPALKILTRHTIQHHRLFAIERHGPTTKVSSRAAYVMS